MERFTYALGMPRGVRIPSATKKLILEEADRRRSGHPDGLTQAEIAEKFNVSLASVRNIIVDGVSSAKATSSGSKGKLQVESLDFPEPLAYDDLCVGAAES